MRGITHMWHDNFSDRFWGLCIQVAVYILNRIPSIILDDVSPFEKMYDKLPSFDHVRVVCCLCFAANLTNQDKFGPRAARSVLVGYGSTQKGVQVIWFR